MKLVALSSLFAGCVLLTASAHAKQLNDPATHDGWLKYGKLGWVWNAEYPWIFHQELGWIYATEAAADASYYWLYDAESTMGAQWYYYGEEDGPWTFTSLFGLSNTRFWKWSHVKAGLKHDIIPIASVENVEKAKDSQIRGVSLGYRTLTLQISYSGGGSDRDDFFLLAASPTSWAEDYAVIGATRRTELALVDGAYGELSDTGMYQSTVTFDLMPLVENWQLMPGDSVNLVIGSYTVKWTYAPIF
ncbi:MAG: hypothetical protein Q7P63_13120 [Verrucomicrobiota bacterium JB022]|nr:hypothetical protein [Verrucomicrobiota bacterium JB022]